MVAARRPAWIVVFDDGAGRLFAQVEHQVERRVRVDEIVVGQGLAGELAVQPQSPRRFLDPRLGLLVRVLAIAQRRCRLACCSDPSHMLAVAVSGPRPALRFEARGDGVVVVRHALERARRHLAPEGLVDLVVAPGAHEVVVVARVGQHRDRGMVLGRGAHQRRSADVDGFDRQRLLLGRSLEGIEVDDDEIQRRNAVPVEIVAVRFEARVGEDTAQKTGVQRLDPSVEDLRKLRELLDRRDRNAGLLQVALGAAGGVDLHVPVDESAGQLGQTALVGHRDHGATNRGDRVHPRASTVSLAAACGNRRRRAST